MFADKTLCAIAGGRGQTAASRRVQRILVTSELDRAARCLAVDARHEAPDLSAPLSRLLLCHLSSQWLRQGSDQCRIL